MVSEDSESDASVDTRKLGVEFGELTEELASHDYPATGEELVAAYGDYELDLPGGSETFREILGKRRSETGDDEDIRFESADEVQQSVLNMVDSDAVGREGYSDRGGSLERKQTEENQDDTM